MGWLKSWLLVYPFSYPQEKRPAHIDKARLFKYGKFTSGAVVFTFYIRGIHGSSWLLMKLNLLAGTNCVMTFKELFFLLLLRWSRANENLFATTGCPGKICSQLLIHHLGHPQVSEMGFAAGSISLLMISTALLSRHTPLSLQPVMIGSATVGSGLSWHRTLPLCVLGGDRKLCFWMTEL